MLLMYSLPGCKWCILAKSLLDREGIRYKVREIDVNKKKDFKDAMKFQTFPLIVNKSTKKGAKKEQRIGGYSELEAAIAIRKKLREQNIPLRKFFEFHRLLGSLQNNDQLRTLLDANYMMIKGDLSEKQVAALF